MRSILSFRHAAIRLYTLGAVHGSMAAASPTSHMMPGALVHRAVTGVLGSKRLTRLSSAGQSAQTLEGNPCRSCNIMLTGLHEICLQNGLVSLDVSIYVS